VNTNKERKIPMTTARNIKPAAEVGVPEAAQADPWQDDSGQRFRVIYGPTRSIADRPDVILFPSAVQLGDGTVDNGEKMEPPVLYVALQEERGLTAVQARALATALVNAAAQLDRWQWSVPG